MLLLLLSSSFFPQERGGRIEFVFISSDRSEKEFRSYFDEMPWLAMPCVTCDSNMYVCVSFYGFIIMRYCACACFAGSAHVRALF